MTTAPERQFAPQNRHMSLIIIINLLWLVLCTEGELWPEALAPPVDVIEERVLASSDKTSRIRSLVHRMLRTATSE